MMRIVVDGCFLPGTMMGTELTWLYLTQWKKEFSVLCLGLISIAFTMIDLPSFNNQLPSFPHTERDI